MTVEGGKLIIHEAWFCHQAGRDVMFYYIDECVRSPRFGLGVVVWSGPDPWVSFIGGERLQADGSTLQIVPDEDYDEEVTKRAKLEQWLTWRITGILEPGTEYPVRPKSDLEEKMRRSVGRRCLRFPKSFPDLAACFILDDLDAAPRNARSNRVNDNQPHSDL